MRKSSPNRSDKRVQAILAQLREVNARASSAVATDKPEDNIICGAGVLSPSAQSRERAHQMLLGINPFASRDRPEKKPKKK